MPTSLRQTSAHRGPTIDLKARILDRMRRDSLIRVWTPNDFLDLGSRAGVDKALQRLVTDNTIRRIDRGLYDLPRLNQLTGKPTSPDYTSVIDAVARRDKIRLLLDGLTSANQLGLTTAVPGRVTVHTDARLRPIQLDNLKVDFKLTAPSRLYWAGRPGMRVVQALHWLRDMPPADQDAILGRLGKILWNPANGAAMRDDLRNGLDALPQWMRDTVEAILSHREGRGAPRSERATRP
ncbi:MAG: DUF6088 family protein [Bryobacteraceae bacterium]